MQNQSTQTAKAHERCEAPFAAAIRRQNDMVVLDVGGDATVSQVIGYEAAWPHLVIFAADDEGLKA